MGKKKNHGHKRQSATGKSKERVSIPPLTPQAPEHTEQFSQGLSIFDMHGLRGFTSETSANGRPLAEFSAPQPVIQEAIRRGIQMVLVPNVNLGSRFRVDTNISAYEAMHPRMNQLFDNLAWIRTNYIKDKARRGRLNTDDLESMALAAAATGGFALDRARNPYATKGELPDDIANIMKVAAGILGTAQEMKNQGILNIASAQQVYDFAEANGLLIQNRRSCPTAEKTIVAAIDTLLTGNSGNPNNATFATIFSDFPSLYAYSQFVGKYRDNFDGFLDNMEFLTQSAMFSARQQGANILPRFESQYNQIVMSYLTQTLPLQSQLNKTLGRDPISAGLPSQKALEEKEGISWKLYENLMREALQNQ